MKHVAALLITVSLVLGAIAATTSYLPRVEAIDAADGLTLAAPAGLSPDDETAPLLDPGASDEPIVLNEQVLARLREAGVERVRVKEFAFGRWDHRLLFLGAVAGLVIGAIIIRQDARRAVAESMRRAAHVEETPEHAIKTTLATVDELRRTLPTLASEDARIHRVVDTLDELNRTHLDAFVQARPLLIGRFGAAGYAQLMDRFAAAERQLNRAWSAAADHVLDESMRCLDEGSARLEETLRRLEA